MPGPIARVGATRRLARFVQELSLPRVPGGPDDPLSHEEVLAKFPGNATRVLPRAQAERVVEAVHALASDAPAAPLMAALGAARA